MKNRTLLVTAILFFQLSAITILSAQSNPLSVTFDYPSPNSWVRDSMFWVKISPKSPEQIRSIDLYVNNRRVGTDTRAPFKWGKGGVPGGPKVLKPGTYKLKAIIRDKNGKAHTQYSSFRVKGKR